MTDYLILIFFDQHFNNQTLILIGISDSPI